MPRSVAGDQQEQRAMELRTRYLVLLLLAEGPKTGYEIMKRIQQLFTGTEERGVSPGTLYPLLRRMMEEGLLEASEEPHGQRMRKVYKLTRRGLETLLDMVNKGLEILEKSFQLHIEAVRGFVEAALDPSIARRLASITSRLEEIEERIRELREELRTAAGITRETRAAATGA